eukprot:2971500-Amphidinium_carterae.1
MCIIVKRCTRACRVQKRLRPPPLLRTLDRHLHLAAVVVVEKQKATRTPQECITLVGVLESDQYWGELTVLVKCLPPEKAVKNHSARDGVPEVPPLSEYGNSPDAPTTTVTPTQAGWIWTCGVFWMSQDGSQAYQHEEDDSRARRLLELCRPAES